MEKICKLFIILFVIIICGEALPKQVCVIGAGRAGLAAIKIVAEEIGKFTPIAFERNSDVGGLWIYTDKTDLDKHGLPVHSSVYKNLKTITPKEQMTYPDYQIFETPDNSQGQMTFPDYSIFETRDTNPYVTHQMFLEYMRNYTDHFGLRRYIQFNTMVTKVTPLKNKCDRMTSAWQIETRNLDTNKVDTTICDGVIVCNGRYSKPNIPKLPGIDLFSGQVLHSHAYRKPEDFTAKTIIIWGAGASAVGIANDLSSYARTLFLSNRHKSLVGLPLPPNVVPVKSVVKFNGRDFVLEDDTKITADAFIYCTGYVYDFPFLDENSGIARDRYRLFPLIRNFINKEHPSMAFVGLGDFDHLGDAFYDESKYFLSTLKRRDH